MRCQKNSYKLIGSEGIIFDQKGSEAIIPYRNRSKLIASDPINCREFCKPLIGSRPEHGPEEGGALDQAERERFISELVSPLWFEFTE